MRQVVDPPHELADAHTLIAQRYAGYFVGHPYRNEQQTRDVTVNRKRKWIEPGVVTDSCEFCMRLTDEEAVRRVAGYQWQLDIESTRNKGQHYSTWIRSGDERIPEPTDLTSGVWAHSAANLRAFVNLFQNQPTANRPNGWNLRPLPMVDLPLRLKRKLCVEWNHLYTRWMIDEGLSFDFDQREFYREIVDAEQCTECIEGEGPTCPQHVLDDLTVWEGGV